MIKSISLLLADDDIDDCMLFQEALEELPVEAKLTIVHDGEKLMTLLKEISSVPKVLFLDLNMPKKNGFECLTEIKQESTLSDIAVVVISTSNDPEVIQNLFEKGASHYIRKPTQFSTLKILIYSALTSIDNQNIYKPAFSNFVIQA